MNRRLASVAALVALVGARSRPGRPEAPSGATAATTFTYASQNSIVTDFDPATSYSNEVIAMNNIYEQLTRYDIARRRRSSRCSRRRGSRSADGQDVDVHAAQGREVPHAAVRVTSQAAKAAIERTIKLKGGPAYIWDAVKTIATPDPADARLPPQVRRRRSTSSRRRPTPPTSTTPRPSGSQDLVKWFGAAHDAGTGPYVVGTWKKGQQDELRLNAFKGYWGGWSGKHYTSALFEFVPQPTTQSQLLQSGEVTFSARLTPQLFAAAKSNTQLATEQRASFQNLLAMLNTASGPLKDVRVRQAVADVDRLHGHRLGAQGLGGAAPRATSRRA